MRAQEVDGYTPPLSNKKVREDKLTHLGNQIRSREDVLLGDKEVKIGDCSILKVLCLDPMNLLLVGIPVGIAASVQEWGDAIVFTSCFIGLVPLAKVLGDATEHLSENLNQTIGGLLNATFGNAVEMIITLSAITHGKCDLVKKSLLGSILSNLLLVLGMAFFAGGLVKKEQHFPGAAALVNVTMLFVGVMSMSLPTVFAQSSSVKPDTILKISRASAIFVGIGYVAYLCFQLCTHADLFEDEEEEGDVAEGGEAKAPGISDVSEIDAIKYCKVPGCNRPAASGYSTCCRSCPRSKGKKHGPTCKEAPIEEPKGEEKAAVLSVPVSLALLFFSTIVVAFLSEYMVDSIDGLVKEWGVPEAFVGVILLPIVGNACEHASAVRMAYQNKVATAIAIAIGSSTQIAMFVVPFSVIAGWIANQDLDMNLHPTGLTVLFLSVLVVFTIVMDAKSNWLEGFMLVLSYCLVAVLYWFTLKGQEEA